MSLTKGTGYGSGSQWYGSRTMELTESCSNALSYHTIPYHTIPYHTIPYHTIPYHTIPYHTIPYHTVPNLTVPYRTARYQYLPRAGLARLVSLLPPPPPPPVAAAASSHASRISWATIPVTTLSQTQGPQVNYMLGNAKRPPPPFCHDVGTMYCMVDGKQPFPLSETFIKKLKNNFVGNWKRCSDAPPAMKLQH
jgi:hypothetical protein